jgi:hypothetical protein
MGQNPDRAPRIGRRFRRASHEGSRFADCASGPRLLPERDLRRRAISSTSSRMWLSGLQGRSELAVPTANPGIAWEARRPGIRLRFIHRPPAMILLKARGRWGISPHAPLENERSVREPRQGRAGYRCFLPDLAGFASLQSMAPDGERETWHAGGDDAK